MYLALIPGQEKDAVEMEEYPVIWPFLGVFGCCPSVSVVSNSTILLVTSLRLEQASTELSFNPAGLSTGYLALMSFNQAGHASAGVLGGGRSRRRHAQSRVPPPGAGVLKCMLVFFS